MSKGLFQDLMKIKMESTCLACFVLKMVETKYYTIKPAYNQLTNTNFGNDSCDIVSYIKKIRKQRFNRPNVHESPEIAPNVYGQLQHCQPTTASVEHGFSMLSLLLAKDRNFFSQNIISHNCVQLKYQYTNFGFFLLDLLYFSFC